MTVAHHPHGFRRVSLGEIEPARSRHMWTRSSVYATGDLVGVGQWDGTVTAFDRTSLDVRWEVDHPEPAVTTAGIGETVVVGGRGDDGVIAAYDREAGERRWSYDATTDVGPPTRDDVFALPYVVCVDGDERSGWTYAAVRRYERNGADRRWYSTVIAFDRDGAVRWRYETDASPIALALDGGADRLAVGYNRCSGDHDHGLVVLDAESGDPCWFWDPGTEGERRVGDVSIDGDSVAVSSHGDKRGYVLEPNGEERWRVDLAVETEIGDETLYAYPNHAYANDGRVAFVTGNTYAREARETAGRHPNEHRIAAFDAAGEPLWDADVAGFVHELAAAGRTVVLPCAQNFRTRDPEVHALRWFDLETGDGGAERVDGIVTAASVDDETMAAIEEPIEYHDEETVRGSHVLHVGSRSQ